MKITIESTDEWTANGVGRIWRGTTEAGIPCTLLVVGIGTETPEAREAIKSELATLSEIDPNTFGKGTAEDVMKLATAAAGQSNVDKALGLSEDLVNYLAARGEREGFPIPLGEVAMYMAAIKLSYSMAPEGAPRKAVEDQVFTLLNRIFKAVHFISPEGTN